MKCYVAHFWLKALLKEDKAFPSRGLLVSEETVELVDGGVTQY